MSVYSIFEDNFEKFQKKINTIQKKCAKYGCAFDYTELGVEFHQIQISEDETATVKFINVDITGHAKINDWEFVGTINHITAGNIIRTISTIDVPERYFHTDATCEHCNKIRTRKQTYLVRNTKTGEFKQIGGTCLKDYTDGLDAEFAAYLGQFIQEAESYSDWGSSSSFTRYIPTDVVLEYAAELIKHFGYQKTRDDYDEYNPESTRRWTSDFIDHYYYKKSGKMYECVEDKCPENFNPESNKDFVADVLEYFKNSEDNSSYMNNLRVFANTPAITYKDLGYVVSMIPTYNRHLADIKREEDHQKQVESEKRLSQYVGEIGDRITIEVESMICISSWESDFGITFLYKIVDTSGNVFVWYASRGYDNLDEVKQVVGTVKRQEKYNGVKQTTLTRCKVS